MKVKCRYINKTHYVRDLARNEEFSEIAVNNIFFSSQKKTTVICGGPVGTISRHVTQLTCKQTRKIYEHSHGPVCQYTTPCVVIRLNVIAIDKYNYMIILF